MKKALQLASVASMIDLFNRDNIGLLEEMGYQVDIACNFKFGSITSDEKVKQFKNEMEKQGIKTYHIPIPRKIMAIKDIISSYKMVKNLCKENNYEIVHCHSPIGGVIARLACRNARKKGTKVIYTAHGFHFFKGASIPNWLIFYPIEKYCAQYTDCLITINEEDYHRAKQFKANQVTYVNGIGMHTQQIKDISIDKMSKRKSLGLTEQNVVISCVGQLSKRKNHEVIIKALAKLNNPNVKFVLCGLGELEEYLKGLVKELKLEEQVIFTGYRTDIKEILNISDIFVFSSLQEGLPVALMEAMATGLPVICSRIRGNVDLIKENKGGYLVEARDVEGYYQGLKKLVNNPQLCKDMGGFNQEVILEFDIENINRQMKKIYREIS